MTPQQLGLAAYDAAHQILSADLYMNHLAMPGGQRTARVDRVAMIIMETMEKYSDLPQTTTKEHKWFNDRGTCFCRAMNCGAFHTVCGSQHDPKNDNLDESDHLMIKWPLHLNIKKEGFIHGL